ncbi:MAG: polymer-forming cytoskeletal protein [Chloroflexota bacterium]|nr:polymer-forming cytoskeletal protein [Anaerolineales bacterium]MCB8967304.1 polymer-forming cytoskeletal protein [Ardenticatenaceae bacterium]
MNTANNKRNGRNLLSILRRNEKWVEISGYRVGDIPLDEPVYVVPGANIVGNIIAPKIRVAGLVYGSTVSLETIIHSDGEIWGDVYTERLLVEDSGKIQGWVSSIDTTGYQLIRNEGIVPEIDHSPGPFEPPTNGRSLERSSHQVDLLRRLQEEAASAIAARIELEQSFDKRLQEVAGEASAKVTSLTEKLTQAEEQITQLRQSQEKQDEELRTRHTQFERQNNELTVSRQLLAERNQELETLHRQHADLLDAKQKLDAAKAKLDNQLIEARAANDKLDDRISSLETALQANLQHSAEQEDALIRWQELAEATQKRTKELEDETKRSKAQLEENLRVTEMLQMQRRQLEDEWEAAMEKLDALQHQETQRLSAPPEEIEKLLGRITELEAGQQHMAEMEAQIGRIPELEAQLSEMERLSVQVQELSLLKLQLAELEDEAQDRAEQLLWYKANLETNRLEFDAMHQQMAAQEAKVTELTQQLQEHQATTKQWRQVAEQTAEDLQKREEELYTVQQTAALVRQQGDLEKKQLREEVRKSKLQIEAFEVEIARFLQEIETQGNHLAEIQTTLVERDIELQELKEAYTKQAKSLQQFKQAAGDRIKLLQTDLSKAKRQLEDAKAVLERRQKRQQ